MSELLEHFLRFRGKCQHCVSENQKPDFPESELESTRVLVEEVRNVVGKQSGCEILSDDYDTFR